MKLDDFLDEKFDYDAVPASKGVSEALPPGEYMIQLEKIEIAYTKSGTGVMLKARGAVVVCEKEGNAVFMQFNIRNDNAVAQSIGTAELKAMAAAIGVEWEAVKAETDQLLYKPFKVRLGYDKQNINETTGQLYALKNKVMRYFAKGSYDPKAPLIVSKDVLPPSAPAPLGPSFKKFANGDDVPF
jgi:hypothetical protein